MKLLLAHNFYRSSAPSGEDIVYRSERDLLESIGIEVVPYERHNDDIDETSWSGSISVALNTSWSRKSYNDVRDLIKETRPDIAHFHNTFPQISPSAYLACQQNGVPVVQTLHNYRLVCPGAMLVRDGKPCELCLGRNLLPAVRHRCYRNSIGATAALVLMLYSNRLRGSYQRLVNRYISLTEFAARRFVDGGLPREKIAVKPNFIDRIPESIPKARSYVAYVGRLRSEKGLHTLLTAWRSISDIPLKIMGDGEMRAELEKQARLNALDVEFLGYLPRDDVLEFVRKASIQIIPSECYEGFPSVLLEAYACGTPVVVSKIGSLDELVEDGKTGLKFEVSNATDLAEKVKELWVSPARMRRMGAYARELVQKRYNGESNVKMLLEIYHAARKDYETSEYSRKNKLPSRHDR